TNRLHARFGGRDGHREGESQWRTEGLVRGVDPVPLVFHLEQVALKLELGPAPGRDLVREPLQLVEWVAGRDGAGECRFRLRTVSLPVPEPHPGAFSDGMEHAEAD